MRVCSEGPERWRRKKYFFITYTMIIALSNETIVMKHIADRI